MTAKKKGTLNKNQNFPTPDNHYHEQQNMSLQCGYSVFSETMSASVKEFHYGFKKKRLSQQDKGSLLNFVHEWHKRNLTKIMSTS